MRVGRHGLRHIRELLANNHIIRNSIASLVAADMDGYFFRQTCSPPLTTVYASSSLGTIFTAISALFIKWIIGSCGLDLRRQFCISRLWVNLRLESSFALWLVEDSEDLHVSVCIFLPSRLTGQINLALSPLKSASILSTTGARQLL